MKKTFCFSLMAIVFVMAMMFNAFAMDLDRYEKIARQTIEQIDSGKVDIDQMMADQEELVKLGVAACREYAAAEPDKAKMMNIVADNGDKMKSLTLEEIENKWHEGGVLKENGIDISAFDHFDKAMCYSEMVIHPATVCICLNEYKKTGDKAHLDQAKAELSEVVEHVKYVR